MLTAWDIYAEQLMSLGYGHPLWIPEPGLESGEVHIGDVGYLRAGGFRFMFNSMSGDDHPINLRMGVPHAFRVFHPPEQLFVRRPNEIIQNQLHSASLRSSSVTGGISVGPSNSENASLRYQCTETSGAILLLKRPGHYEFLDCRLRIKDYMLEHFSHWRDFANDRLGIGLQEKEILFVSGHVKTEEWAEAAFRSRGTNGELSISGGFLPLAPVSGEFSVSITRCDSPSLFYRSGPTRTASILNDGDSTADEKSDQCVFLHYYKMKNRILWPTIRAAAGPHELPRHSEDPDEAGVMASDDGSTCSTPLREFEGTDETETFDPVSFLLDYILEHSAARIAFASDQDLTHIFPNRAFPNDIANALRTMLPAITIDEHGVGMIGISVVPTSTTQCPSMVSTPPPINNDIYFPLRSRRRLWDQHNTICQDILLKATRQRSHSVGTSTHSISEGCLARTRRRARTYGDNSNITEFKALVYQTLHIEGMLRQATASGKRSPLQAALGLPSIPLCWLLTPQRADHLFKIFFKNVNIHWPILDQSLHSVSYTILQCPTLFTIVCTISSRYDANAPELYPTIVSEARNSARLMLNDLNSLELAQAYILMAMYDADNTGKEQSPFIALASKILKRMIRRNGTNVHRTTKAERERVNVERLWLLCYILDLSTSIGFGRKPSIKEDDIIQDSKDWYKRSGMNVTSDIRISAHVQLLRVMSRFHQAMHSDPSVPEKVTLADSVEDVVREYDLELDRFSEEWKGRFGRDTNQQDPLVAFNISLISFLTDYSRLVIFSTALLQESLNRDYVNILRERCFEYAKSVIDTMVDTLVPTGFMRASPDVIFLYATAAGTYLAKSTATYSSMRRAEVVTMLNHLAAAFLSPQAALDKFHSPAVHARLLSDLVKDLKTHDIQNVVL